MNKEILMVVDAVSNEKGVDKEVIFEALEAALAAATRKKHGEEWDARVAIDRKTGDYDTFRRWKVFADDSTELEFPDKELRFEDGLDMNPDAEIGGFGGIFDLAAVKFRDPLLVATTDGVGTTRFAGAFDITRPMDPAVGRVIQSVIDKGYSDFTGKVAAGQAGHRAEGARGRARASDRPVQGPRELAPFRRRQAGRQERHLH